MKFMKKNRPDVMIIILLILWGIYEIFVVPFEYDTLVSIFVGFNLVYLLVNEYHLNLPILQSQISNKVIIIVLLS